MRETEENGVWHSLTGRQWRLRARNEGAARAIVESLHVSPLAAQILAARGYDASSARAFVEPSSRHLLDPTLLHGLPQAVERIDRALRAGEKIRLVTDYDVDGTTSCLILHAALDRRIQATGSAAEISYHIPDRFVEGYGLSSQAVEKAAADGVSLLVTADIGVRDHASIRLAAQRGVEAMVCDHHLPPGEDVPPDAVAVVCPPQKECRYPNKALAACGVSLKLATALLAGDPRRDDVLGSMLKLAAIGTVADVVDLATPENRAIVALGLERLNGGTHAPGLRALLEVADLGTNPITTTEIGFRVAPRINAAGRLKDANAVVRLMRERDPSQAMALARALDVLNHQRQGIQLQLVEQVLSLVPDPPPSFLVASGPEEDGWHRGVVGIVAAKVRERLQRPVAVVAVLGGVATGSIRSVPQIHAVRALDSVAPLLKRYGGHAAAAGFSLATENLGAFEAGLQAFVDAQVGQGGLVTEEEADAEITASSLVSRVVEDLRIFEPTGKGNPQPRLIVRGPITRQEVMKECHLKFRIGGVEAVWWNEAERIQMLSQATAVLGTVSINRWNGQSRVQVLVEDIA